MQNVVFGHPRDCHMHIRGINYWLLRFHKNAWTSHEYTWMVVWQNKIAFTDIEYIPFNTLTVLLCNIYLSFYHSRFPWRTSLSTSFTVASLALGQSYNCSNETLNDKDNIGHHLNTGKHHRAWTMGIIQGIYCIIPHSFVPQHRRRKLYKIAYPISQCSHYKIDMLTLGYQVTLLHGIHISHCITVIAAQLVEINGLRNISQSDNITPNHPTHTHRHASENVGKSWITHTFGNASRLTNLLNFVIYFQMVIFKSW